MTRPSLRRLLTGPSGSGRSIVLVLGVVGAFVTLAATVPLSTPAYATNAGAETMAASVTTLGPRVRIAPQQAVAILLTPHVARQGPSAEAARLGTIRAHRPITGERTVLPVMATHRAPGGVTWLRVRLPGRPNGHSGWIDARATRPALVFWHLLINLGARRVTAYLDGVPQRSFPAVVGKPSSPTPTGNFFVEETDAMPAGDPGGPYALALSARSNVFHSYDGGPGQVAVHGRNLLGGTLGQAQSHGCVRLATSAIIWLIQRFTPGAPVTIIAG